MEAGYIYRITCLKTGKYYIGQATEFKHKNGKAYNYGITGRWSDHVSAANRDSETPLSKAIIDFGVSNFKVEEITKVPLYELDALEASWIQKCNSLVPNGYNVCSHSRNRHRDKTSLAKFYKDRVETCIIRPIREKGEYKKIYLLLTLFDGTNERITFGQKLNQTYNDAKKEALEFVLELECPYKEETTNSYDQLEKYAHKIYEFTNKHITKIRITTASSLIAVYITTSEMKSYKDQIRICFGGKSMPKEVAYEIAKIFVQELSINEETILQDHYQCPQQAAALTGVTTPSKENSVIVT